MAVNTGQPSPYSDSEPVKIPPAATEQPVSPVTYHARDKSLPVRSLPGTRPVPMEPPDADTAPVVSRPTHDPLKSR